MALSSTEQALALLLILNSAHLTAADCSAPDRVPVSGSAGGRAVLPCSYTPTPGLHVEVRWHAYPDPGKSVLLIASKTPSANIPAQWSGRVKLSDEVSSGNASLLISELRLEDTRDYMCTVQINGICFTYRNVKLTVQGPPKRDSTTSGTTTTTTPTTRPSVTPSTRPSATQTTRPSATPTTRPSATPSTRPSATPSTRPSATPTTRPSATPTTRPSATPTTRPSATPTTRPSATPTTRPSATPTTRPSATPTTRPSATPTTRPSATPSTRPSATTSTRPSATQKTRPSASPTILSAVAVSAVIGIIGAAVFVILKYKRRAANANRNNQNAEDLNAISDLLTYAVVNHKRQPGGAPVRSGVSAVDNTEYATVRTLLTQPPGIQESFNNKMNQGLD